MEWLLVIAGVFLVLIGIADVFFTVLHYDAFGFLSSRLYSSLFGVARFLMRPMPRKVRALGLSLPAPLMVPLTISVWILLILVGYALIYYAHMSEGTFYFSKPGTEPSLGEALYMSGTAISTAGFGDVTPTSGIYQALAVSEALTGFGILTLAFAYVTGVFGVLQRLGILAAGLYHQASDTSDALSILALHFPNGEPQGLDQHVMTLYRELIEVYEGLRRYPVVYYYHSRRAYRSIPYSFRMIGGMAGALRWGLPTGHPGSQAPWLPTLITGLETIIAYLEERFLYEPLEKTPEPVPFEAFEAAFARDEEPSDPWLDNFLEIDEGMRELALIKEAPDPKDAYSRYLNWLPFAHRNRVFYEASARDLGFDFEELAHLPGERLF